MHTWEWVVIAVVLAGALVFTLAWRWIADFWADAEHKRFKGGGAPGTGERVVIRRPGGAGGVGGVGGASAGGPGPNGEGGARG